MHWFYIQNETELGPVTSQTIRELLACGVLSHATLIRNSNSTEWLPIHQATLEQDEQQAEREPIQPLMSFYCPGCGQKISTEYGDVGKEAECPSCHFSFTIPAVPPQSNVPHQLGSSHSTKLPEQSTSPSLSTIVKSAISKIVSTVHGLINSKNTSQASLNETDIADSGGNIATSKKRLKPRLIKAGVIAMACLIGMCGLSSVLSDDDDKNENSSSPNVGWGYIHETTQCDNCNGYGKYNTGCYRCSSRLTITAPSGFEIVCPTCQGTGRQTFTCKKCRGSGKMLK